MMTKTTRERNWRPNILERVSEGLNLLWPLFIAASIRGKSGSDQWLRFVVTFFNRSLTRSKPEPYHGLNKNLSPLFV